MYIYIYIYRIVYTTSTGVRPAGARRSPARRPARPYYVMI